MPALASAGSRLLLARSAVASTSTAAAVASSSSSSHLPRRAYASEAEPADGEEKPVWVSGIKANRQKVRIEKMFDEYNYDETSGHGHEMVQKERDALAFMRTVELELPKLKPIPFTPPNVETDYVRFHTQKTWPQNETGDNDKESAAVTLSAPISRLPLDSPAALHKFLLLTNPEFYRPFRAVTFDNLRTQRKATTHYTSVFSPLKNQTVPESMGPPTVPSRRFRRFLNTPEQKMLLHRSPDPRAGGWTPQGVVRAMEQDRFYKRGVNERDGEDQNGWVVIKCELFPYQLQNKKWTEDTLRRLIKEANDQTDPMTDIPLDLTPYWTQWRAQKRRPDGSAVSAAKDWPQDWALPRPRVVGEPVRPEGDVRRKLAELPGVSRQQD